MKAITLRNLPPDVARTVQQRAKQKKTSVNKAVIELLEESVGGKGKIDIGLICEFRDCHACLVDEVDR